MRGQPKMGILLGCVSYNVYITMQAPEQKKLMT